MNFRRLLSRLRRDVRGTAIVETAIVLPVVVLLLFGLIEFGRLLQQHHVLNKSVRDAARYLAREQLKCPANTDPNWATVKSAAQHLAATGRKSGGSPLVAGWTDAEFDIPDPVCEVWSGRTVQVITVSADIPFRDLGFLRGIGLSSTRLVGSHQQVHIGE